MDNIWQYQNVHLKIYKLKEIRSKLGLTQQQIADECNISQTTYSNYEVGLYLPSSLVLYTICYNHGLSMDEIVK